MPALDFTVEDIAVAPFAAVPQLGCKLRIDAEHARDRIDNIALQVQVRIDAPRRHYVDADYEPLSTLFGEPARWGKTLRSLLWMNTGLSVPAFEGCCFVELPLPCSYDFNVTATRYFDALHGGEVPLEFLFSGSLFYRDGTGALQITQIPWTSEAAFKLPLSTWQAMMARFYPDSVWLRVPRGLFDDFHRYTRARGYTDFHDALDSLLQARREETLP
jgi:hypothetical protein